MQLRQLARKAGIGDDDVLWVKSLKEDRVEEYDYDGYSDIKDFEWPNVILEEID